MLLNALIVSFCSFLWPLSYPSISIRTLQDPSGQGGLALPGLYKYLLAGQMVFARHWLLRDDEDAAKVLEAAILGSYEGLSNLVYRGSQVQSPITGSIRVTIQAWDRVQVIMHRDNFHLSINSAVA